MAKNNQDIVTDIKAHIAKSPNTKYGDWYVGIASDPKQRLFSEHNVSQENGSWIYTEAVSSDAARAVEKYFIEQMKTDGGSGGGDSTTRFVYAYRKTFSTIE
jgi:hypothetical protein